MRAVPSGFAYAACRQDDWRKGSDVMTLWMSEGLRGPSEISDEVQQADKVVLSWTGLTDICYWKSGSRLLQLWIARTVSRELKRNRGSTIGYRAGYAAEQALARIAAAAVGGAAGRGSGTVGAGQSPEQGGRLRLERGVAVLSAESIHRFIYAQIRRTDDTDWRNYLPRRKYMRGYRRPGGAVHRCA